MYQYIKKGAVPKPHLSISYVANIHYYKIHSILYLIYQSDTGRML